MDLRVLQLVDHLLLIEHELQVQGWWSAEAPSSEALSSQQPFCVDTLAFEQWLQWIFLPRMKEIIEQGYPLPAVSGIQQMGEMVYVDRPEQARALLALLGAFDRLIAGSAV
ncbi:YqcC family protein [Pseudomonas sp. N040]|uniref:YqcC family protein n=1 Tax=Pseudomonas sp. N040 TaxID=2785325 RepID=UPI0018A25431|nr:YqcC family protein [Pseudomonas sp. N040]MBW7014080.1 YqcC family protein [Pseudomonas sp. N040]